MGCSLQVVVQRTQCSSPAVRLSTVPASPRRLQTGHLHVQVVVLRLQWLSAAGQPHIKTLACLRRWLHSATGQGLRGEASLPRHC